MGGSNPYGGNNNFGYTYTPDLLASYGVSTGDGGKNSMYSGGVIPPLGTTPWDSMQIERMVQIMTTQHDGHYHGAAMAWGKIVDLITGFKDTLTSAGTTLESGWNPATSDAAANFFQHVGASTWSLDDWITFAAQNQRALESVAGAINTARTKMAAIYKNFLSEWNFNIGKANYYTTPEGQAELMRLGMAEAAGGGMPDVSTSDWQKPYIQAATAARTKYTDQAKQVMQELAGSYTSNWGGINEGRKFQGPTNAVNPLNALENRINQLMNAGGGGGGNQAALNAQLAAAQAAQQAALQKAAAQQAAAQQAAQQAAAQQAAAEQQLAAQQAAEQAAAQAAAQQLAAQQAAQQAQLQLTQQLAAQQLAAQQLAAQQQLAQQQLTAQQQLAVQQQLTAQQQLATQQQLNAQQQLAQQQAAEHQLGNPASFPATGAGQFTGAGPGAIRTLGATGPGAHALGDPTGFDASGPGGRAGGAGNPLLGRSGFNAGESGGLPGAAGLPGRGGPGGLSGRGAPGNLESFRGGPGGSGAPGSMRGGSDAPGSMRGGPGAPGSARGAPGSGAGGAGGGAPQGGRGSGRGDGEEDGAGNEGRALYRPDSEDYLADMPPGPGTAQLLGGMPGHPGPATPVGPNLGARGGGRPGAPGGPGQPGTGGRGRSRGRRKDGELTGRRRHGAPEADDDLMATPSLSRPDLTGRNGLPAGDFDKIAAVVPDDSLLGARQHEPLLFPPLFVPKRRRSDEDEEQHDSNETADPSVWAVEVPDQIETPVEKQPDERGGGSVLGS